MRYTDSQGDDPGLLRQSLIRLAAGTVLALVPWIFLVGPTGCRTPPPPEPQPAFSFYRAPQLYEAPLRRVVMLPLENATKTPHIDAVFGDAVATQVRAANLFEVVRIPEAAAQPWLHSARLEGRFREEMLVAMARQFNADAVLYGSVNEFHGYWPPRIGVTLHLIGTAEAITLASIDGVWDARHKAIAEQAEIYYTSQTSDVQLPHNDLVLNSPQLFTNFVANQIAHALTTPGGVEQITVAPPGAVPSMVTPAGATLPEELPPP